MRETLSVKMKAILLRAKIQANEVRNVSLDAVEWAVEYSVS